jgi:uncharacterized protein (TIGR02284 family)
MKNAEILNDLIKINNDRVDGYSKAATQADDEDLKELFTSMAAQSQAYITDLKEKVTVEGEDPAQGTTFTGKIYRTWMDVKATFNGDSRKGLLDSCEFGEDAAQKAYKSALDEKEINSDVRQLIEKQQKSLKESHDVMKRLRDTQLA